MNLLQALLMILAQWRPAFCKNAAFVHAKELAFACLCGYGRKTITNMAIFLGRSHKLPIAEYKFYSECKWNVHDLFNPILKLAFQHVTSEYICFAADDTKIRKSGKKIPNAGWHAYPLGSKFQTNLIWALRYLQISVLLPLYVTSEKTPARSIPVKQHKDLKGLKTQNLRDHMSEAELIFTALAELSTRQIAESTDAIGMIENTTAAKTGGGIVLTP